MLSDLIGKAGEHSQDKFIGKSTVPLVLSFLFDLFDFHLNRLEKRLTVFIPLKNISLINVLEIFWLWLLMNTTYK